MRFVITVTCLYSMAIPSHVSMDTHLPIVAGDEGKASGFYAETTNLLRRWYLSPYPPDSSVR